MLRITAETYMNLGTVISEFSFMFYAAETALDMPIKAEEQADLKKFLLSLKKHADELNLKVSSGILDKKLADLPQNQREFELLISVIKEEIKSHLFLYIPRHRAIYHELVSNFESFKSFPDATHEAIRAGSCYAVGEYTACVFHSMRMAELGLKSLAKYLNVSFPFPIELADWQNIIDKIESEIKELNKLPKSAEKDEKLKFCSGAAAQFRYFKDAYRKHVAHARENSGEYQEFNILEKTNEFMRILSKRLSE